MTQVEVPSVKPTLRKVYIELIDEVNKSDHRGKANPDDYLDGILFDELFMKDCLPESLSRKELGDKIQELIDELKSDPGRKNPTQSDSSFHVPTIGKAKRFFLKKTFFEAFPLFIGFMISYYIWADKVIGNGSGVIHFPTGLVFLFASAIGIVLAVIYGFKEWFKKGFNWSIFLRSFLVSTMSSFAVGIWLYLDLVFSSGGQSPGWSAKFPQSLVSTVLTTTYHTVIPVTYLVGRHFLSYFKFKSS